MSEYLVILHDAEPPTNQGRDQLRQELIAKLGISETDVSQMFESLPVILKENVSREHAEDFLKILESMGANVEILASSGSAAPSEGDTPLLQVSENEGLVSDSTEDDILAAPGESIEDLEEILNGMLAGPDSQAQETESLQVEPAVEQASSETFVMEPEPVEPKVAEQPKSTQAEDLEDLNKILEEELGLPGMDLSVEPENEQAGLDDAGLSTFSLDVEATDSDAGGLEAMFDEALASVEQAQESVKQEAQNAAPVQDEVAAVPDTGGLSLELDSAATSSEPEVEPDRVAEAEETVAEPKADTGLSFDLSLDDAPEQEHESALESALGDVNQLPDEDEEDPFAGLHLPGEGEEEQVDAFAKPAVVEEQQDEQSEDMPEEELANAFASAEIAAVDEPQDAKDTVVAEEQDSSTGQGANANAENESTEAAAQVEVKAKKKSKGSFKDSLKRRDVQIQIAGTLFVLILFVIAVKPDLVFPKKEQGLVLTAESTQKIIERKEQEAEQARLAAEKLAEVKPAIQRWGDNITLEDGTKISIDLLSDGNKILEFDFLYEGAEPEEITPEELVDGIDRPWVTKIHAKALSLAEVVERTTSKMKTPQKILIAESPARAKVSDLKGNSLFAGKVRVELVLEGTKKMKGKWKVTTSVTPEAVSDSEFHVKRLGSNSFELALNGSAELTPLTLTKSKKAKSKSKSRRK